MTSTTASPIVYSDGMTTVQIGDVVSCRAWLWLFRKKIGRVTYVPGISKLNRGMEHGGMRWVGTRFEDGTVIGTPVDPETGVLKKSVQFLQRADQYVEELNPDAELEG